MGVCGDPGIRVYRGQAPARVYDQKMSRRLRKWSVVVLMAFFTQGVLLPLAHAAHGCLAMGAANAPGMPSVVTGANTGPSPVVDAVAGNAMVSSMSGHHAHHFHDNAGEAPVTSVSSDCANCEAGCHFVAVVHNAAADSHVQSNPAQYNRVGEWFVGRIPPVDSPPPIVLI